ncbi:ArgE/DapE-related deacylase [Thermococcus kodakarensis KOD1]|uniref:ArgE/DapE-related deacylase n=1 Tax=Thermococcus kodakarensis (strain ATCC BAA-918 / JCM 12380 / KOD1) TaxID=69014 RepID=Q5JH60_THEKO|nr:M20/M25/M40 family metallo-hydrolase [Thermococcus kodakarensis]WCN29341.1 M20/M25/M40 family metallo-hydrolase [Thermococcus kodakarensis]WCN29723.1 M20/M25/M40 family metallo-hydrolase [Thermococcus kodakarensis]BAD85655.1 ArgE/DapE-related deacylase [Thermococcus kodakarensis KOD1]
MDVLELLSSLVSFETVNDPARGIRPSRDCPAFIRDTLASWGIESELIERDGYYAVYGEIGEGKPKLLFMAHFDVVPVNREEWETDPFKLTVKGDRAYGRGSADDKGNVASIMLALKELSKEKLDGKVLFAFTGDEEIGGRMAMHIAERLAQEGKLPEYMVNADGIGMKPIIRRRKGFGVTVRVPSEKTMVKGTIKREIFRIRTPVLETRHAAYFLPGVDTHPLIAASHFLRSREAFAVSLEGKFLKGNVVPGEVTLTYVVPGEGEEVEVDVGLTRLLKAVVPFVRAPIKAEKYSDYGVSITPNLYSIKDGKHILKFDVRAMSRLKDEIEQAMREVAEFNLPKAEIEVATNEKAGYLFTHPEEKIVRVTLEVLEELGEKAEPVEGPGAADSRFFTPYGVKAIDFGPRGGNIHGPNEYVEIDSLRKMPALYAELARRLVRE